MFFSGFNVARGDPDTALVYAICSVENSAPQDPYRDYMQYVWLVRHRPEPTIISPLLLILIAIILCVQAMELATERLSLKIAMHAWFQLGNKYLMDAGFLLGLRYSSRIVDLVRYENYMFRE